MSNLLKKRLKNAVIMLLKVLTFLLAFAGVVVILGTAGASDLDRINMTTIFLNIFQGFLCCGVAWVLNFIKLVIK